MMPDRGDEVAYRSFAGETWDAKITNVRPAGFVDIEISGPGLREPMSLTAIRWYDDPAEKAPGARPRKAAACPGGRPPVSQTG